MLNRVYGVLLKGATNNYLMENVFEDAGVSTLFPVNLDATSSGNMISGLACSSITDANGQNAAWIADPLLGYGLRVCSTAAASKALHVVGGGSFGLYADETTGYAVQGNATTGRGIYGTATAAGGVGVYGSSTNTGAGTAGYNNSTGPALYGNSASGYGVQAASTSGTALYGTSATGPALAASNNYGNIGLDQFGHFLLSTATTPTVTSCGTGSSVVGSDSYGRITTAGVVTTCTLNFAVQYYAYGTPKFALVFDQTAATLAPITAITQALITFTAVTAHVYAYVAFQ
jgi:hypothetical protein